MQRIDRDSRQYVQADIAATLQGQPYNPTADLVEFAFTTANDRPTTWYTGGWDGTNTIPGSSAYRAQVLVGPVSTGPTLAPGTYTVWIRITDNPEQPIIPVGQLNIA